MISHHETQPRQAILSGLHYVYNLYFSITLAS